jgi:hypothetical protein
MHFSVLSQFISKFVTQPHALLEHTRGSSEIGFAIVGNTHSSTSGTFLHSQLEQSPSHKGGFSSLLIIEYSRLIFGATKLQMPSLHSALSVGSAVSHTIGVGSRVGVAVVVLFTIKTGSVDVITGVLGVKASSTFFRILVATAFILKKMVESIFIIYNIDFKL